jgi:hypothetical protein
MNSPEKPVYSREELTLAAPGDELAAVLDELARHLEEFLGLVHCVCVCVCWLVWVGVVGRTRFSISFHCWCKSKEVGMVVVEWSGVGWMLQQVNSRCLSLLSGQLEFERAAAKSWGRREQEPRFQGLAVLKIREGRKSQIG